MSNAQDRVAVADMVADVSDLPTLSGEGERTAVLPVVPVAEADKASLGSPDAKVPKAFHPLSSSQQESSPGTKSRRKFRPSTKGNNAYSGAVVLALQILQPEDSTSFSSLQYPPPHSAQGTGHPSFHLPAQPPDVYPFAASSPLGAYKYQQKDYWPLLEPRLSHFMNPEPPETMQTPPVSAHPSPNDPAEGEEQQSRKRSHSVMSNEQDFTQQMLAAANAHNIAGLPNGAQADSRSGSIHSGGGEADGYSPRGSRAYKRNDPPKNENGKYICDYSEDCREFAFDRKCEWSKHMDKHDRPYRCPHHSCGKLQGFTYSGGLLRHEREVHGKHGGLKAQLMCPHSGCKRHTGKGFTRKENLNEHLRRVHFGKDRDPQDTGTRLGAEDDEAEIDTASQEAFAALTSINSHKRKRSLNGKDAASEVEMMRQEIAALRAENVRKDAVIMDLTRRLEQDEKNEEQAMRESIAGYQQS